jgi:hypothetical protein
MNSELLVYELISTVCSQTQSKIPFEFSIYEDLCKCDTITNFDYSINSLITDYLLHTLIKRNPTPFMFKYNRLLLYWWFEYTAAWIIPNMITHVSCHPHFYEMF